MERTAQIKNFIQVLSHQHPIPKRLNNIDLMGKGRDWFSNLYLILLQLLPIYF